MIYGLDGDGIGRVVEALMIRGAREELRRFSTAISEVLSNIAVEVSASGGTVVFCAGDSILFEGDMAEEWCYNILETFAANTGRSASMGIGTTMTEAYLALRLAKAQGGGKLLLYTKE